MADKGRPTKYDSRYCQALIDFFDVEPYEDRELEHYDKDGNLKWIDYKRMANPLPTLRKFAKSIKVHFSTVYEWIGRHKEFSDAFTHAKDLQKWFLIENGLNGCYNPTFAIFTAKNISDMRDFSAIQVSGDPERPLGVVILPEQNDSKLESPSRTPNRSPEEN